MSVPLIWVDEMHVVVGCCLAANKRGLQTAAFSAEDGETVGSADDPDFCKQPGKCDRQIYPTKKKKLQPREQLCLWYCTVIPAN